MGETTDDAFLGGHLQILQPAKGYRAGIDPVLLAAFAPARPGNHVLELGCGVGTASLCLAARVPGLALTGIEVQAPLAELARQNGRRNNVAFQVETGDLSAMPRALLSESFDIVLANPPYFDRARSSPAPDPTREAAQGEATPLARWVDAGLRRLRPKGWLVMIHRTERLPDLLAALCDRAGDLRIQPLAAREGRAADRILLAARKGAATPLKLAFPIVVHDGPVHKSDSDSYSDLISTVLRSPTALSHP